ncbi:MAG TPA: hypothetical protein VN282_28355 [Pyrinomonadaceae bacterium]|nr:hypothetical protein [Pyrinomonadaceae bacterium]
MKYGGLRKGPALLLTAALLAAQASARAQAGGVAKEEETAARAAAAAFAERLQATQDFAAVVPELFAADFMSRRLRGESEGAKGDGAATFMLEGVPALTFERALAEKAGVEDWTRLYVAAANTMHFVFQSLLSRASLEELSDPGRYDPRKLFEVFPPEAVRLLDKNPALANFLTRRHAEVTIKTSEELREAAATLEEVVRLSRPRLEGLLARGAHLGANLRLMREASGRDEVTATLRAAEELGYPRGTRLYRVFAPNGYMLTLVKSGGAFRVVWATLPHD